MNHWREKGEIVSLRDFFCGLLSDGIENCEDYVCNFFLMKFSWEMLIGMECAVGIKSYACRSIIIGCLSVQASAYLLVIKVK